MSDFTYGTSEIGKKEYGVFVRTCINQDTSIKTMFNTSTTILPSDVRATVEKGLFLDLELYNSGTPITSVPTLGSTYESKIIVVDFSGGDIEIEASDFPSTINKVYVFYSKSFNETYTFSVTDSAGNIFTATRSNQGVVVFVDDEGDSYIADSCFTPIGVAQESPTLMSEKGETFKTSYGNDVPYDENWSGEASIVQVTKANHDFLEDIKFVDVDYAVYAHTSVGSHSGGMLLANTSLSRGNGHILVSSRLNPSLQIRGNDFNLIKLNVAKNTGIASNVYSSVDGYFPTS